MNLIFNHMFKTLVKRRTNENLSFHLRTINTRIQNFITIMVKTLRSQGCSNLFWTKTSECRSITNTT